MYPAMCANFGKNYFDVPWNNFAIKAYNDLNQVFDGQI
jgi:hypothetical protein